MQSERGWLSRSGVRKPVAPGFATAPAGVFALPFWGSRAPGGEAGLALVFRGCG